MKLPTKTNTEAAGGAVSTKPTNDHDATEPSAHNAKAHLIKTTAIGATIFLVAFCARVLMWHDARLEVGKVQSGVVAGYRYVARILMNDGIASFFSPSSPLSDPNTLGHPPGYSILMALVFRVFGESDAAIQFVQISADAIAAVLVFLIASELLPKSVAIIAGLLVALSPQLAWNSILLLPDMLAVLPILLAVYCMVRAVRRGPRLIAILLAGALIGLSCWFRANAMLFAPFLAAFVPALFERGKRLQFAAALLSGALLVIAPLTIRNAFVFRHFIPISLGAGQTLLEGIADYDREGRFGLPDTDMGIMKMEAELYNRPDYSNTLFNPDGVKRERMRLARGFSVIRSHPVWFFGVMIRRAASMLRLERARLVSAAPPISHSLTINDERQPVWSNSPAELIASSAPRSTQTEVTLASDSQTLRITGDDSKYGDQIVSAPIAVEKNFDYLLTLLVKLEQGRMALKIISVDGRTVLASTIIEIVEGKTPQDQPLQAVQIAFVSDRSAEQVRVALANEASGALRPVAQVGTIKLFALGSASYVWTRFPRAIIRNVQKLFLTAFMLPLVLIGVVWLTRKGKLRAIALLLAVPAYYLCVQSAMHTEYRYVLAVHYFLFVLAAASIFYGSGALWQWLRKVKARRRLRFQP